MVSVRYQKEWLKDRILACWIGKNIGGTIGGPFEGRRDFLDVKGYTSPKGEPLPNDDLDLQLAWFLALKQWGIKNFDVNTLADSWQMFITPSWAEYGVSKKNLHLGLLPPLSGEFRNDKWKHSNGAWIRSEVWACLAPGFPNVAIRYAIMDACVDHGMGEGTYAEIYTASLQSLAFFETDVRTVVEKALNYIPETSRVSQCVKLVLSEYDKKTPYREVREKLVESTADLGWFMAPANVGFVVLGLIYGEGDFKKTMLYTVNCGDDTDCTGGTVGAVMGIMGGTAVIPEDWKEYIGDRIIQKCINGHYSSRVAKTCTEFTDWIIDTIPELLAINGVDAAVGDETVYDPEKSVSFGRGTSSAFFARKPYSFEISDRRRIKAVVEYDREPVIKADEPFDITVTLTNISWDEMIQCRVDMVIPDGWTADYQRNLCVNRGADQSDTTVTKYHFTVTPGQQIAAENKLFMVLSGSTFAQPFTIPFTLLG